MEEGRAKFGSSRSRRSILSRKARKKGKLSAFNPHPIYIYIYKIRYFDIERDGQ